MSRKRGKLSLEEESYILENAPNMTAVEIGNNLGRTEETIHKYCKNKGISHLGMSKQTSEDVAMTKILESRPYWKEVLKQFNDIEIEYFRESWIRLYKQFKEDLLYSEELQLKQMITHEIMGNRVLQDRLSAIRQLERLEEQLEDLYDSSDIETDEGASKAANLEGELSMMRGQLSSFTKEHSEIQKNIKAIQTDMKAARSDRIKKVENSQTSFAGLIQYLEQDSNRRRLSEDIEIQRLAKDAAKRRLSQLHTYEDGFIDQPFLTPETLMKEEDEYAQEEVGSEE